MRVIITDYAWPDLAEETSIFSAAGIELIDATQTGWPSTELAAEAGGILACWATVRQDVIAAARKCKAIGRMGIGLDNIDVWSATDRGIVVTNVPSYCIEEVSDHTVGLILALARRICFFHQQKLAGVYGLQGSGPLLRLKGRTLGIVGLGAIGTAVATKARALGMQVVVNTRRPVEGFECLNLPELLQASDFVSIHLPLTPDTRRLFNREAFSYFKPGAYLINTSRGDIVDTDALLEALDQGLLAGAALDVLPAEPPAADDPVLHHDRIIVTPHAAFLSTESLLCLRRMAASQMVDALTGRMPANIVNPEVLTQSNLRLRV